ncbi:MAG: glycosyltransferase family 4 protein [Planctomycetota bacterium]
MKILFVGPRGSDPSTTALQTQLVEMVEAAAARGHRVRLVQPRVGGATMRRPESVSCDFVDTREPPFRKVAERLVDIPTERTLSARLREDPPEVVHVHGFGGRSSYLSPWLGERLGYPVVIAVVDELALLCHRETLIDAAGAPCEVVDDPARCRRCCRAADRNALGRFGAVLARLTSPLRGIGPYPTVNAFANRLDMVSHGLSTADVVCVRDAGIADRLVRMGVPSRGLRSPIAAPKSTAWDEVWRQAIALHAG